MANYVAFLLCTAIFSCHLFKLAKAEADQINRATAQPPPASFGAVSSSSSAARPSDAATLPPLITALEFITILCACDYPLPTYAQYRHFKEGLTQSKISSRRELAMFLAQILHESNGLTETVERRCARNPRATCTRDYKHPALDVPPQLYYGRGYIQLTWSYNYKAASRAIFGDDRLLHQPDTVLASEKIKWLVSFWYWDTFVHVAPAVVEQGAFGSATMVINGNTECHDPTGHRIARIRFRIYGVVCDVLGIAELPNPRGCYPTAFFGSAYSKKLSLSTTSWSN